MCTSINIDIKIGELYTSQCRPGHRHHGLDMLTLSGKRYSRDHGTFGSELLDTWTWTMDIHILSNYISTFTCNDIKAVHTQSVLFIFRGNNTICSWITKLHWLVNLSMVLSWAAYYSAGRMSTCTYTHCGKICHFPVVKSHFAVCSSQEVAVSLH